ncbi:MAG: aconitase X, partial [Candidatus Thorarchaeota archaeon]
RFFGIMFLTSNEESILAGEHGQGLQAAFQLIVDVGDFFGAEKLIPISSAHISGVSYLTGRDGLLKHLKYFVDKNSHVSVTSTLNPCGMDRVYWKDMFVKNDFAHKQFQILDYYQKLGVSTTCSCTPYDFGNIPLKGQHIAWAESSAICFANTYFGARTNKEDALSVLAAAISGKTSYYGFHLRDNRVPNIKVIVDKPITDLAEYGALGHIVGDQTKTMKFPWGPIPVFELKNIPRPQHIKTLGAALASFGTALYHIKDVTPEQELLDKLSISETIKVTSDDIDQVFNEFSPNKSISSPKASIVVIGCPNASLEEIIEVVEKVKNKKIKSGKEFWVFTNRAQKALAEACGYLQILTEAGVKVYCDTCPEVFPYDKTKFPAVMTNSAKAVHYIPAPNLNGIPTYLLPLDQCVERFFE